ncbi:unnamed protein product [Musa acuminata subsp. malaccensis]|uniref:(wild Malaysian banana) hypothetical protein n=1 Tax=Musa acuminata subsp. malaccensis TaxID=214687 RepID=A0A804LAA7_MUSAM|nr:unnamed protein product [Musa acuminata subsp. malaccensis]
MVTFVVIYYLFTCVFSVTSSVIGKKYYDSNFQSCSNICRFGVPLLWCFI